MDKPEVSEIDLRILNALRGDARAPISDIAREANVSRATAYSRIAHLRETGIISGFTVQVDPYRVGHRLTSVLLLKWSPDAWLDGDEFVEQVSKLPSVEYSAMITGEFDVLLLVRLRDADHLRTFIEKDLRGLNSITATRTMPVLHEYPNRSTLIPTASEK